MSISYADVNGHGSGILPRRLVVLMVCNGIFAAVMLFGWTLVSFIAIAPIEWATWAPIYRSNSVFDLLKYPFVVLWLWPLAGSFGAWLAFKGNKKSLAMSCAAIPVVMLLLVFGFYYLAPVDWR